MVSTKKQLTIYESVINITNDYLGPASRRFIDRQIENHFDKQPEELGKKDLDQLVDWIRVAISLLTEDRELVREYTNRLLSLGSTKLKE